MTLKEALHIIGSDTESTAWSGNDYAEALEVVLSSRISKVTRAYATGIVQGMLLMIGEFEASRDENGTDD